MTWATFYDFFFFCTNLVFNNKERRERKREQKNMEGDRPS